MGEALITHRGGGGAKTGFFDTTNLGSNLQSMTIPDLVGAKNAVLWYKIPDVGGYRGDPVTSSASPTPIHSIEITDGEVSFIMEEHAGGHGCVANRLENITFDSATGTITIDSSVLTRVIFFSGTYYYLKQQGYAYLVYD